MILWPCTLICFIFFAQIHQRLHWESLAASLSPLLCFFYVWRFADLILIFFWYSCWLTASTCLWLNAWAAAFSILTHSAATLNFKIEWKLYPATCKEQSFNNFTMLWPHTYDDCLAMCSCMFSFSLSLVNFIDSCY